MNSSVQLGEDGRKGRTKVRKSQRRHGREREVPPLDEVMQVASTADC